jgi:hypothetical protein
MTTAVLRHALNVIFHSSKTVEGNASSPAAKAAAQHPFSNHLSGGTIQRASRSACAYDSRAGASVLYRVRRANAHEWHFDRTSLLLDASRTTEARGHRCSNSCQGCVYDLLSHGMGDDTREVSERLDAQVQVHRGGYTRHACSLSKTLVRARPQCS